MIEFTPRRRRIHPPFLLCEPSCVGAGWRQPRSGDHSLPRHMQMLDPMLLVSQNPTFDIFGLELTLFASVTIHMGLERRRAGEPLVTHLALVLLLCVGRHLGAKLTHHRLGSGWCASRQKVRGARKGPRQMTVLVGFRGGRAIIGNRRFHRCHRGTVVGVVASGGDRRSRRVSGGKAIRVARAPRAARTIDVARRQILAKRDHSPAGIQSITESRGRGRMRLTDASITVKQKTTVSIYSFPLSRRSEQLRIGGSSYAWDIRRSWCMWGA